MTKAERIEAMARAIHDTEVAMFDSPTWLRRQAQAQAAYDAADVEGMVRAGCYQAITAHINRRVGYNEDAAVDAIVGRVCGNE